MPEEELNAIMRMEINALAATFYQMSGRIFMPDFDFSKATHPEETGCWNKACVAFAHIQKDKWFLQFQV